MTQTVRHYSAREVWWALLVAQAKLVATRDWRQSKRQSWSARTYGEVWMRRLSVAMAKQLAAAALSRVPMATRKVSLLGVAGAEDSDTAGFEGYSGVAEARVLGV